jgi:glutaredoxin
MSVDNLKQPNEKGYTIYGLSVCWRCHMLKENFEDKCYIYEYVNCDSHVENDKEKFKRQILKYMDLPYIEGGINKLCFPVVFKNGKLHNHFD